jgi:uncharacterized protein (DUF952 family)
MLYHLAQLSDWQQAQRDGAYRVSTIGRTLEQEGFIHTSFAHQVRGVADRFYATVPGPLVLLQIDEERLGSPWRVDPVPGTPEGFPHVYGPVGVAAVVAVTPVTRTGAGEWAGLPGTAG